MNRRAQVLTVDLLMSLFLFILLFTSVVSFLYTIVNVGTSSSSYYSQVISSFLNNAASAGVDTLVGSQGSPLNWEYVTCSSIGTLGVMHNYYEASPQKLYNLTTLPVSCLSQLLRAQNTFNVSVSYINGTPLRINGVPITVGFQPPKNAGFISSIQRYVVLYPNNVSSSLVSNPTAPIIVVNFKEWLP